jgi:hypothetical protein
VTLKDLIRKSAHATRIATWAPLGIAVRLYGGTDKLAHGYTTYYTRHFRRLRYRRNRILEIGVGGYESRAPGGSLRVWRDYFPRSHIFGLDIFDKAFSLGPRVHFFKGDQSRADDLEQLLDEMGSAPDIVIDDGSHLAEHALASLRYLFPRMRSGSIYAIEDLHTSYWADWGGAWPAPSGTAVDLAKGLVDAVQDNDVTFTWRHSPDRPPRHWLADVATLHVYPGLALIEKA